MPDRGGTRASEPRLAQRSWDHRRTSVPVLLALTISIVLALLWIAAASAHAEETPAEIRAHDHTAPVIGLAGSLTEQERLGTTQPEYQLSVAVSDGTDDEPQSGVAKVEVKVDGKKVSMSPEGPWNPNCSTKNCSVAATWTLKAASYSSGPHEVAVVATDAVGLTSTMILEIELGPEPLETSFTTPHPTYEDHQITAIGFKATKAGAPLPEATFKCSLEGPGGAGATPTPCTSPYKPPVHLESGWYTFKVSATANGVTDPSPATWRFNTGEYPTAPAGEKLVYPEDGTKSASYFTLEAEWNDSATNSEEKVTGVSFQMELPGSIFSKFEPIPTECVVNGQGKHPSWPLPVRSHPGRSLPVYLKVSGCTPLEKAGYPEQNVKFRATFDGGAKVSGASAPAAVEYVYRRYGTRVPTDATETIGPATVDLLTGAMTISKTDVSIPVPGYETKLEFTRVYSSAAGPPQTKNPWALTSENVLQTGPSMALGGTWQPSSPLESEGEGEAFTRIEEVVVPATPAVYESECWNGPEGEEEEVSCYESHQHSAQYLVEEPRPAEQWIELLGNEGYGIPFQIEGSNLVPPAYAKEIALKREEGNIVLTYPNGYHTIFVPGAEREWLPKFLSFQASPTSLRMVYETHEKELLLKEEIAPSPVVCEAIVARHTPGCRTLYFEYETRSSVSGSETVGTVLHSISYYGPSGVESASRVMALYSYERAYSPPGEGLILTSEVDPRTGLGETFGYELYGKMTSLKPSGQEPWQFEWLKGTYSEEFWINISKPWKLKRVTRGAVKTTLAYGVPITGSGAPYDLSSESIGTWGQSDLPVNATAVFPPTHSPTEYPPKTFTGATIHYLDPEGRQTNVASPSPPGVSGSSIVTTENDAHGNVTRELSPQNRLRSLNASNTVARSHELDSRSMYNAAGTELLETWGPLKPVRLESGESVEARSHLVIHYDEGEPPVPTGTPRAYLPTKETTSTVFAGHEVEGHVTETRYNWALRLPEEVVKDPSGLDIRSITHYNERGQVSETRQPKAVEGNKAGDTQTVYWAAGGSGECNGRPEYANLPCKISPAAQASGTGRPSLDIKTFPSYNYLDEPTEITETSPGDNVDVKSTRVGYDSAGRPVTSRMIGGVEVPESETLYSPTTGLPEQQRFVCEGECSTAEPTFVGSIGESGSGNGQLNGPRGVALDSKGDVWVVDRANGRIEEFSGSGKYLFSFGKIGTGNGEFTNPWGIAIDASGNIWVADSGNCRIQEFNSEGVFLQKFGTKASGASQGTEFVRPDGIAVAPGGMLWVTDNGGPRVAEFRQTVSNESERFVRNVGGNFPTGAGPEGVAVDAQGDVWVTDEEPANKIFEFSSEGKMLQQIAPAPGHGQLAAPTGIAIAPSGNVLVSDTNHNRVSEFTSTGTYLRSFGTGTGAETFSEPKGIAISPTGAAFIADKNRNQVKKWNIDASFNARAVTTTYNAVGQITQYEDADGAKTKTTYDAYGRPSTVTDEKGTETLHYDESSGLLTSMEVSGVGTFTAAYDADGDLITRGLPNGITERTTYNVADEPVKLVDTKASSCGESCTWFEENLERSGEGRILTLVNSLVKDHYSYDMDGRLTEAQETPTGGQCVSRAYKFDADSNRLSKTTRTGTGGACATSGGTTQSYEYDEGDRLSGNGVVYDPWGRITNLPAEDAGGKELVTSYFANSMVATQSQAGVTNSYQLDASGRPRQREQVAGVAGTEVFHYDGPDDSPSWTALGSTWSRNIPGIGGELAAVQESTGTTTFKLTDLHGDVIASASSSPTATHVLGTFRYSEFGELVAGEAGRFGWLGASARRTELPSGVIQMGARSYAPQLGRFLTPDPVAGGSANAYDYANQDPVNEFDMDGDCPKNNPDDTCHKGNRKGSRAETAHEHHKFTAREHHAIVKAARQLARHEEVKIEITVDSVVAKNLGRILKEENEPPTPSGLESFLSSVGATISSVLPSCAEVGAAADIVSGTTGSISIGLSIVPGAQGPAGALGLVSGGAGLVGAAGDTLGKEGDC